MIPDRLKSSRGVALLITLTVITLLIATTMEINQGVRNTVISAATSRDRITLSYMASSGIHAAMAMLIKDKYDSQIDSIQEDWANPEKIAEVLQSITFDEGNVTFKITDELSRIQINSLVEFPKGRQFNEAQRIMWDRFARLVIAQGGDDLEDVDATTIINSIKDWLDSGDDDLVTGLNGAESDYYEGLDPPYKCKNGPFTDINELLLVKGMTPALFYGMGEDMPGISNYITVYGMTQAKQKEEKRDYTFEGKININTADLPVLVGMVSSENFDYANEIYNYRSEKSDDVYIHDLSSPTWYKNVPGGNEFNIDPNLITLSSDFFRIEATASLKEQKMTISCVVQREKHPKTKKWVCRILNWETI
jgi:general secretion pathway protein K